MPIESSNGRRLCGHFSSSRRAAKTAITGAITASGGSWNASIVAEVASWGNTHLSATGLGAYIANATENGDFPRVVLGIAIMCILVTLFNRLLWRPLYAFGERRLRLG